MTHELWDGLRSGGSPRAVSKALRVTTALVLGVLTTSALGGCNSAKLTATATATATPTPAPRRTVPPTNPLTGVGARPTGPVIAVKLDDTYDGRPTMGLEKADVIYIEQVEGGMSRMLAVFASAKPTVRAVRSVRAGDPELLGPYGRIILVASGGGGSALPALDRSGLHSSINDRGQIGFRRDHSRPAPYNLVSDLAKVSANIKAEGVRDVGFTWATADPQLAGAKVAKTVSTRVGATIVSFVWDSRLARYVRTIAGLRLLTAGGGPVAKPNVLVQYCQITPDPSDVDVLGNPSMFTHSIGSGRAVLFRNGRRIEGRWSRPSNGARTTFTDAAGKPLLFAPGGTFVALVGVGAPS